MQLTFSCALARIDAVFFWKCVKLMTADLHDPNAVSIILTDAYEAVVRARLGPSRGESFQAERITGLNVAKVFPPTESESCTVILNARLFYGIAADSLEQTDLVSRIVAHEGRHILAHERREGLQYLEAAPTGAQSYYFSLAGIVFDEYRAERSVAELGWPLQAAWRDAFDGALAQFRRRVRAVLPQAGQDIDDCLAVVYAEFSELTKIVAYEAGNVLAGTEQSAEHPFDVDSEHWRRLVGPNWDALLTVLRSIPGDKQRMDAGAVQEALGRIAQCLHDWLAYIGFGFSDTACGVYFSIVRHDF
jgi:hypothetical protein